MTTDLVKTETPSYLAAYSGDLGVGSEITTDDFGMDTILFMQSGSTFVKEDRAKQGAIIAMSTLEELGYKEDKPLEFIVIGHYKYWVEQEAGTQKFIRQYEGSNKNEQKWEEGNIKRIYNHAFYVVLPCKVAEGDTAPFKLIFRSSGLKAAETVSALLAKATMKKTPSHAIVFKVTTKLMSKDKNTWFVPMVSESRMATEEEFAVSTKRYNDYKTSKAKFVDNTNDNNVDY